MSEEVPAVPTTTSQTEASQTPREDFYTMDLEALKKIAEEEIPKVNQPSKKEFTDKTTAIDMEIKSMKERQEEIKMEKQIIKDGYKVLKEANNQTRAVRKELLDKRNTINEKRKAAFSELKSIKSELDEIKSTLKDASRYNAATLRDMIYKAEIKIETESLTYEEEKGLKHNIQQWEKDLKQAKNTDGLPEKRQSLETRRKAVSEILNETKVELDEVNKELGVVAVKKEETPATEEEKKEDPFKKLNEEFDELRKKIDAKYKEKNVLYEENRENAKKFREYQFSHKRQGAAQRALERRNQEIEEAEAEKKAEEELLKRPPYEKEMSLCDLLLAYMEKLSEKEEGSKKKEEKEMVVPEGMTLFKKEELDLFCASTKKSKKEKKEKKSNKKSNLNHSLDTLESFTTIYVNAPKTIEDIPATIELIKSRKSFFDALPRGSDVKAEIAKLQ